MKLSAVGATSITLVPATATPSENSPTHLPMSQVVISTNGVTPPAEWGTVAQGTEYDVILRPRR